MNKNNLDHWLKYGGMLRSSGTTGKPKDIYQSVDKIHNANKVALDSQEITSTSKILTVCKTQHAGGLLAQTLPAHSIGCEVDIKAFNAYEFNKIIHNYTHTHLTPDHCKAIMHTKSFLNANYNGLWITCGSDKVHANIIKSFVERGAVFMSNWGMTEIGPCAINKVHRKIEDINFDETNGTVLGNRFYCEYKIKDGELHVKGNISVFGNEWYNTKDLVNQVDNTLYYIGRT